MWAITRDEPTPTQRSHARGEGVTALSIQQFKKRLLNSEQYLEARLHYRFGSATDPENGSDRLPEDEYVEQPLTRIHSNDSYTIGEICDLVTQGNTVVLLGPFGAGKSLTLREVFRRLRSDFYNNRTPQIPLAINLRDHWGQQHVDEVLRRHGDKVGFDRPAQLVRAWKAGQVLPLLDGFDEIASPVMPMGRDAIRKSREEALRVIQAFMRDARGRSGVLIAGRDHYFDSIEECKKLLNLPSDTVFIEVGEFSEEQAVVYLKKRDIHNDLPNWLPRKPLLLGYCASRNLLEEVVGIQEDGGVALAWDRFLDRICEREADLSQDIDSDSVRRLLEDLATRARTFPQGSGPLLDSHLSDAYKNITGFEPLEAARTMLQRLPGLTARDQEVGARSFVDDEMMEALRAGPVARFIQNPYLDFGVQGLAYPLTDFSCSVARHLADNLSIDYGKFQVAAEEAAHRWNNPTLALDIVLTGAGSWEDERFDAGGLRIVAGLGDVVNLEDHPIKGLELQGCMINLVRFGREGSEVNIVRCSILKLEGISDQSGLPPAFVECDIDEFDDRGTNAAIVRSELPGPVKVLLVMIRKLFLQRGSGRLESALTRGVTDSLQPLVAPVRDLLLSQGIVYYHVTDSRTIWHGNRTHRARVLKILESPTSSNDPLLRSVEELSVH